MCIKTVKNKNTVRDETLTAQLEEAKKDVEKLEAKVAQQNSEIEAKSTHVTDATSFDLKEGTGSFYASHLCFILFPLPNSWWLLGFARFVEIRTWFMLVTFYARPHH